MWEADIAIAGTGAAGLSLAHALARPEGPGPAASLLILQAPEDRRPPPRTWCFWAEPGACHARAVSASWRWLRVHDRQGRAIVRDIDPLRYQMIRSPDFEALVGAQLDGTPGVRRVTGPVTSVRSLAAGAEARIRTPRGSQRVACRWLFDSRPVAPPAARTMLLQHFRGWFVRTRRAAFDPQVADWMDFRTPQPERGMSFGYVLPLGRHEALVEYTEFSAAVLPARAYHDALDHYTRRVLRLGDLEVVASEDGVIPMTGARFARRAGPSVFRIGAAGGATRPATGYTFSAIQRQSHAIARACRNGLSPLPPRPYRRRSVAMDAVLLHALAGGALEGADFFPRLFREVPAARLLRFLDGTSRPYEDLAIGVHTPVPVMLRSAAALAMTPRRHFPAPAAPPAAGDPAARRQGVRR
jgi:lycopene beta-cyclase